MVRNQPSCEIIRPSWTGANADTGEQGTRSDVILFTNLACWFDEIPNEIIIGSAGVFQPGAIEVILYDAGQFDSKDLIKLEGKLYKIVYQKYCSHTSRNELQCNPYYD
jgi:hypothetical protein